ncbi:glutamate receptor ionotropic, delta-1-like [Zootermopsis nevadensis]|nr:glutamate receptor ionotropic, delta-1-like [Zootermopsis nevadensis]
MNFTIEYLPSEINGNGVLLDNGSWNGVVGILQRREADASIESLTMTSLRWNVVDLLSPLWVDRKYMFIKAATEFELSWLSIFYPFNCPLWFALIASILLLSTCLGIICQICHRNTEFRRNGLLQNICNSLFFIFSVFCGQGEKLGLTTTSIMVVCVSTDLLVVVLLASYSASLMSYLIVRRPRLPFRTFSEFLADGTFTLGVHRFSSLLSFFETTEDPVINQLYLSHIAPHKDTLPMSHLEGYTRVCSSHKYVYIHFLEFLEDKRNKLKCELTIVPGAFLTVTKSIALIRNSSYRGLFRYSLTKLRRNGILQQLLYVTKHGNEVQETPLISMDMTSLAPIFTVLAFGLVATILSISLEFAIHKCKKQKQTSYRMGNDWVL